MSLSTLWNLIPLVGMALVVVFVHWVFKLPEPGRKRRVEKFNPRNWVTGTVAVTGGVVSGVGWFQLMWWCTERVAMDYPGRVYWVAHSHTLLMVPAAFMGLVSSVIVVYFVFWAIFRGKFAAYRDGWLNKLGAEGVNGLRKTGLWFAGISAVLMLAGTGWFTVIKPDVIVVDRAWSPVTFTYPYDQVKRVRMVAFPVDTDHNNYYFEVEFNDGEKVRTEGIGVDTAVDYEIIFTYAAEQAGLPVEKEYESTGP